MALTNAQKAQAIVSEARRIGAEPLDLARIISYETRGTFSTSIKGGSGNRYEGLLQFGPSERSAYGVTRGQEFTDQLKSATRFLQDRGFQPGMGLAEMYSIVNAGSLDANGQPRWNASDGNGTVRQHVARMESGAFDREPVRLAAASNIPNPTLRPATYDPAQFAQTLQAFGYAQPTQPTSATQAVTAEASGSASSPSTAMQQRFGDAFGSVPGSPSPMATASLDAAQSGALPLSTAPMGNGRGIESPAFKTGSMSGSVQPGLLQQAQANLRQAQQNPRPSISLADLQTLTSGYNGQGAPSYARNMASAVPGAEAGRLAGSSVNQPNPSVSQSENMAGRFTDAFAPAPTLSRQPSQPNRVTTSSVSPPAGGFEPPMTTSEFGARFSGARQASSPTQPTSATGYEALTGKAIPTISSIPAYSSIPTVKPAQAPGLSLSGSVAGGFSGGMGGIPLAQGIDPAADPAAAAAAMQRRPAAAPVQRAVPRAPQIPQITVTMARAVAQKVIQQAPQIAQRILGGVGVSGGNTDKSGFTFNPSTVSAGGQSYSPMGGSTVVSPSGTIMSPNEYVTGMAGGNATYW